MRTLPTDDELVAFIESLPETEELLEELSALSKLPGAEPERVCECCKSSLLLHRRDGRWFSQACRQWGYEQRLKEQRPSRLGGSVRPGCRVRGRQQLRIENG